MKQERVDAPGVVLVQAQEVADSAGPGGEVDVVIPEVRPGCPRTLWFFLFALNSPILILLFPYFY